MQARAPSLDVSVAASRRPSALARTVTLRDAPLVTLRLAFDALIARADDVRRP